MRARSLRLPAGATFVALAALILADHLPASAQQADPVVPATDEPMVVDARLDEPAWSEALALSLRWEWFPSDNDPAPVDTTVLVTYDAENLYIAFRAADPDPTAIRAHYGDRDTVADDDTVGFLIDPFADQRRAFQFRVNPLGVQMDAINSDVEASEDFSWDAIWESAGRITADGYVVELAIPFRQLRFPRTAGPQTWRFMATRDYPRSLRHRMRSIVTDKDRDCLVCQLEPIAGFRDLETGVDLEVTPTLTSRYTEERSGGLSGDFEASEESLEPGVTAEWGVTPSVSLAATLNPDFSQVEADAAQLDVNTRFALFFPERRPFFLEGADVFLTPLALVFTRTVADPRAGLKLTGKEGPHAFGAFVTRDRINNLVLPGAQGSSLTSLDEEVTAGVLRWRRDLSGGSSLGLLYTGRIGDGDYENHLAGVDGLWRVSDSDLVRYQVVGSSTRYPDSVVQSLGQPSGRFDGHALTATYSHSDADWYWYGHYREASPELRADHGFVPRVGVRATQAGVERRFRGDDRWFSNLYLFFGVDGTREYDGAWTEWGSDLVFTYTGPLQSYVNIGLAPNQEHFGGVTYHNFRQSIDLGIQPSGDLSLELDVNRGEAIDFTNQRQGEFVTVSPEVGFFVGRRFEGAIEYDRQVFDVEGGRLFTLDLAQATVLYHFGLRSFLRAIVQHRSVERDPSLYTVPVEAEEESVLTQLLFSYKLNARTVLLLGYSDDHLGLEATGLTQTGRTMFLKVGYAFLW